MTTGGRGRRSAGAGGSGRDDRAAFAYTTREGRTYYLHGKPVVLPNGRAHTVYYFAAAPKPVGAVDALPAGYRVVETSASRRPWLRKWAAPAAAPDGGARAAPP